MQDQIIPHGGELINLVVSGKERDELLTKAKGLTKIVLNEKQLSDLDMMACGALSPLKGFMNAKDYNSVVQTMHLANGLPWSLPITLSVSREIADKVKVEDEVSLCDGNGTILGLCEVEEKYNYNKETEAKEVYKTTEMAHPGVFSMMSQGDVNLAGPVRVVNRVKYSDFVSYRIDPKELRQIFKEKGWKTIVGFQTRNPIHRAHEYIQKCALELVDGLLVHPLVGATKSDDVPVDVRMKCYEVLLANYYPAKRTMISAFPAAMRYAGPREAIFHALVRKNYGCTHFIVGRDHAGVGNYYGTYDAQLIFSNFDPIKLGIEPFFFEHTMFCKKCQGMVSAKTCPHSKEEHIALSGSKVREMLVAGIKPPVEFSRPEVARILIDAMKK